MHTGFVGEKLKTLGVADYKAKDWYDGSGMETMRSIDRIAARNLE